MQVEKINNKKDIYFPIKVMLFFLLFSESFVFWGPIDFSIHYPLVLIIFLLINNIALFKGYKSGVRNYKMRGKFRIDSYLGVKIVKIVLLVSICLILPRLYVGWNLSGFSISQMISKFQTAISEPDNVYRDFLEVKSASPLKYLLMFLGPIQFMSIPIGVYYYKYLPRLYKIMLIVLIIMEVVYCMGKGIRKNILDVIVVVFFVYCAANNIILFFKKKKSLLKITMLSLIAISGLIYYFLYSTLARFGTDDYSLVSFGTIKGWYVHNTSPIFYYPFASVHSYLCHAYKNLSLALNHSLFVNNFDDFVFTFGFGNNSFTLTILDNLGIDLFPNTNQYILQTYYNIPSGLQWQTIYAWIANDVTFLGCPLVVYFIGKYFAYFWLDCKMRANFFAIPMLALFSITIVYFFANNQALSFSFIPFVIITFFYIINRYKFRF